MENNDQIKCLSSRIHFYTDDLCVLSKDEFNAIKTLLSNGITLNISRSQFNPMTGRVAVVCESTNKLVPEIIEPGKIEVVESDEESAEQLKALCNKETLEQLLRELQEDCPDLENIYYNFHMGYWVFVARGEEYDEYDTFHEMIDGIRGTLLENNGA